MRLLSIFQRKDRAVSPRGGAAPSEAADAVRQARERARRRLMGAVVLLGIAIIGFPLLFETQPRPIPVDIPIEIPRKDNAPPLAVPPARVAVPQERASASPPAVITETAADAGREVAAPLAAASAQAGGVAASAAAPARNPPAQAVARAGADAAAESARIAAVLNARPSDARADKPEPRPGERAAEKPATVAKAAPAPDAAAPTAAKGKVVIQVGAFSEANAVRDARAKVEKLGLKTYTQVIETDGGKRTRVRVGPFATREEAEKAAAQIKSAGLPAALLTL